MLIPLQLLDLIEDLVEAEQPVLDAPDLLEPVVVGVPEDAAQLVLFLLQGFHVDLRV